MREQKKEKNRISDSLLTLIDTVIPIVHTILYIFHSAHNKLHHNMYSASRWPHNYTCRSLGNYHNCSYQSAIHMPTAFRIYLLFPYQIQDILASLLVNAF